MVFNSFLFVVFFSLTYFLYGLSRHRLQNWILLVASYVFYAAWDYRFLSLILISTLVDYFAGLKIDRSASPKHRKIWVGISLAVNLSLLGFFKYFNFFIDGFESLLSIFGFRAPTVSLQIILPVGISFYTFQTLSYTIDIYKRKLKSTRNFLDFALFVAFFPQLVAGPIERAARLLPQISAPRSIDRQNFYKGIFLIFYGLFEKVVVADNLSVLVDQVYNGNPQNGLYVLLATYAFAFQIFADFDGYSNMAKGLAALMGFDLMDNFHAPYLSKTPSEFWSRWHISLSTWLRDYLYVSFGGNRHGNLKTARNLLLTMLLGGLWHGAGWNFILWGGFHALLLIVYLPFKSKPGRETWLAGTMKRLIFFHLVCFGWMLFRCHDMAQFNGLLGQMVFNFQLHLDPQMLLYIKKLVFFAVIPMVYQAMQYSSGRQIPVFRWPAVLRTAVYVFLFYFMVIFGYNNAQSFIYFQF